MLRYYDQTEETTERVMLPVDQLTIGMQVVELDRPWSETNFLFQGFVISSKEDLQDLREQCSYVYVEVSKSIRREAQNQGGGGLASRRRDEPKRPQPGERVQWVKQVPIEREMTKARGSFQQAREFAKNSMAALRMGMELDVEAAKETMKECVESLLRNEDAMLFLTQIKNRDEYTAQHSMNVGTMAAAFGMHLGHTQAEVEQLGLCGLLHDVGKVRVPEAILNKPGRLTEEEMTEMNKHTLYGRNILMGKSGLYRGAIDVAYAHHERLDGTGYPRKLEAHKIPYYAQIVSVVDIYDAITSARCYKPGMAPHRAMEILNQIKGTHIKEDLIHEFRNWMGVYPPGSLVELNTGEVAVVVSVPTEKSKLRPRVLVVLTADKEHSENEFFLNLESRPATNEGQIYTIKQGLPTGEYGIDISKYIDRGALEGSR